MATGTSFPAAVDSYANKSAGDWLTISDTNKMLSGMEAVQTYTLNGKPWVELDFQQAISSATIDLVTGFTSTYDHFLVALKNVVPATDGASLNVRVRQSGNFQDGASAYQWVRYGSVVAGSPTVSAVGSTGDAQIILAASLGNGAGRSLSGMMNFADAAGATYVKIIRWEASGLTNGGLVQDTTGSGSPSGSGAGPAITGLRFFMSTGNISVGDFRIYGLKK